MVRYGFAFATLMMLASFATAQPAAPPSARRPAPIRPPSPQPVAPPELRPAAPVAIATTSSPAPQSAPRAPWENTPDNSRPAADNIIVGTLDSEPAPAPDPAPEPAPVQQTANRLSGEEEEGVVGNAWQGCCNLARAWRKQPSSSCGDGCCEPGQGIATEYTDKMAGKVGGYFSGLAGHLGNRVWGGEDPPCGYGNLWEARGKAWGSIDVVYWKLSGDPLPPLVTTSPTNPLTPVNVAGNLPGPNDPEDISTIVFGNRLNNADWRAGLRGNMGFWLNSTHTLGVQMSGLLMESQRSITSLTSDGTSILARPFLDVSVIPNIGKAQLIGYPDTVAGQIDINDNSTFSGYDFALRGLMAQQDWWRLDALIGYRQLRMTEQLLIQQQITAGVNAPVNIGVPTGTVINTYDRFDTANTFRGLEVGVAGEAHLWKKLSLTGSGKVSFGVVDQGVGIDGATVIAAPGLPINGPLVGGLLALNSNIGAYRRSDWSMVPELSVGVGYQMTQRMRLKVGYDLLYLPNVQRAGGAIPKDLGIDVNRIPPQNAPPLADPARPTFPASGNASDLFLQGIHAGIEFRF